MVLNKRKLRVRALPSNLPDVLIADISALELGGKLFTSSIESENFTFVHPDNTVICQVRTSRAALKEADVEEIATEKTPTEAAE